MATIEDGWRSLDDLRPNPANFNEHTKEGVIEKMAARIRCNAFTAPFIVTPDNLILGGHLRRLGLMKLRSDSYPEPEGIREGWQVPVRVFTGNAVQEKAILVGDNPALDDLSYDNEALSSLLAELQADGGLEGAGYSDADLDRLIGELAEQNGGGAGESGLLDGCDPDDVPEDALTRCKAGDLWALGEHRLLCGDSTTSSNLERLMGGVRADLLVTSPPYNQQIDKFKPSGMHREHDWVSKVERLAYSDSLPEEEYQSQQVAALEVWADALEQNASVFYNHKNRYRDKQVVSPLEWLPGPFKFRQEIIWSRPGSVTQNARMFLPSDERIFWLYKGDDFYFDDSTEIKTYSTVWNIAPRANKEHAVAFPVELPERCIRACSKPGDIVLEPYCGSGTTVIAAEDLGRRCYALEVDPVNCDTTLARWERCTGRTAELLERAE